MPSMPLIPALRAAYTRLRGREPTRDSRSPGSAAQRTAVRSPTERMLPQSPRTSMASGSASGAQDTMLRLQRTITSGSIVRTDAPSVPNEFVIAHVESRTHAPYPFAFHNVREALLVDASFGKDAENDFPAKAIAFVRANLQASNFHATLKEARRLGAKNVVKSLENVHAWSATSLYELGSGPPVAPMLVQGAASIPGGFVTISKNDPYPVRYWFKDNGRWKQDSVRYVDTDDSSRPYSPNAIAPFKNGFVVFDDAGGLEFYDVKSPRLDGIDIKQTIAPGKTRRAWTSAASISNDCIVATTREGTVHVFKQVGGTWGEKKSLKAGYPLDSIVALGDGFAVSGNNNDVITVFDARYKTQKLTCDRPVASLTQLTDGTLLSIDKNDHAQVWSNDGKKWSPELATYAAGRSIAVEDGFVSFDTHALKHHRKVDGRWEIIDSPLKLNEGLNSPIRGVCRTDNGYAITFERGAERVSEIRTSMPWLLDWNRDKEVSLADALSQGSLGLAQEAIHRGEAVTEQLLTNAAIPKVDDTSEEAAAAQVLCQLAYCDGIDVFDHHGHTLVGMALTKSKSAFTLRYAAQHIASGATVADVDVTKALHMATSPGMFPVLAALIQQGKMRVDQLPKDMPGIDVSGFTLAMAIARLHPVNDEQVAAAGNRFGFFPSRINAGEQEMAALNMLESANAVDLLREFTGRNKKDLDPVLDAIIFLAHEGEENIPLLKALIAAGDVTFWSRASWEDEDYEPEVYSILRDAEMPAPVLARYASQRAPDGWSPPLIPHSLSNAERAHWLQSSTPTRPGEIRFAVIRDDLDGYRVVLGSLNQRPTYWQTRWIVTFLGEDGLDYGGLSRAFVRSVLESFTSLEGLMPPFSSNKTYTYFKPETPGLMGRSINADLTLELRNVGRLFGRAIAFGMTTGIELPPHMLDMLAGRTPDVSLNTLAQFDPDAAKGLSWNLDNPDHVASLGLTFSVDETGQEIPLRDNIDPKTTVDASNVRAYVDAMAEHILMRRFEGATEAFMTGVYDVVDARLLSNFRTSELVALTAGTAAFDTAQWRKASMVVLNKGNEQLHISFTNLQNLRKDPETPYQDVEHRAQLVDWFFQALDKMSNKERGIVFEAVTVSKRVPGGGFAALPAPYLFKFAIDTDESGAVRLDLPFAGLGTPKAATCDSSIKLPEYPDAKTVEEALIKFVEEYRADPSFGLK